MPDNYAKLDDQTYVKIPDDVAALPPTQMKAWIMQNMHGQAQSQVGLQGALPQSAASVPPLRQQTGGASGEWQPQSFGEKFESGLIPEATPEQESLYKSKIGKIPGAIAAGAQNVASQMSSPENLAIVAGSMLAPPAAAAGGLVKTAEALRLLTSGYFGAQSARALAQVAPEAIARARQGDYEGAAKLLPATAISALGALGGAKGVMSEAGNIVQTASGPVEKNAPASVDIKADLNQALEAKGVDPTDPQAAAEKIAEAKGIESPVAATQAEQPISQAIKKPSSYEVQHEAPAGTPDVAANVAHELDHVKADEQGAAEPPEGEGANDQIVSKTAEQVKALPVRQPPPMATPQLTKNVLSLVTKHLSPTSDVSDPALDVMSRLRGTRNAAQAFVYANDDLTHAKATIDALPQERQLDIWDALKGFKDINSLDADPQIKQTVSFLRNLEDQMYEMKKEYAPKLGKLENHFTAFWDFPEEPTAPTEMGRQNIAGSMTAFKQASRLPVRQIMEQYPGAQLRYPNPIDAFRAAYQDDMRFYSSARALDEGFRGGMVRATQDDPAWVPLAGKGLPAISQMVGIAKEGQQVYGDPGFARLWNNYFGDDAVANTVVGRGLLAVKNATTGYELMLPTVHLGNISRIASSADFMQSAFDGLRGNPVKAADLILDASVPGRSMARLKEQFAPLYREMGAPDFIKKTDSRLRLLFDGGLTADFEKGYLGKSLNAFKEGLQQSPLGQTLDRILSQPERLAGPLFRQIQMAKVTFAMDRLNDLFVQKANDLATGKVSQLDLARRATSMADNYMGMVNYRESWFWDATFRSAMQIAFRAPGWFLGSLRGAARGIADLPKAMKGEVTPEAAMFVSSFIPTAMHAVMVQSALTGTLPGQDGDMEDYIYPRAGGVDANGKPSRVSVFGYPNEWTKYGMATINPILGKSMNWIDVLKSKTSGMFGRAMESYEGKDFYGRQLSGPQRALHLLPQPFFIQSQIEAQRRGTPINTFMGDKPSPSWLSATPATDLMSKISRDKAPAGGVDPDVWADRQKMYGYEDRLRANPGQRDQLVRQMGSEGVPQQNIRRVIKGAATDPLVSRFKSLSRDEATKVYAVANPSERAVFRPMLLSKIRNAKTPPSEEQRRLLISGAQ